MEQCAEIVIGVARAGQILLMLVVTVGMTPAVALGAGWVIRPNPSPPRDQVSQLSGVSCVSADACIAVGGYVDSRSHEDRPLTERWDGTSWVIQPSPEPSDALRTLGYGTSLSGVSCLSPSACTAVGSYLARVGHYVSLAERWDGTSWVVQPTPNPPGAFFTGLSAVSCASASACTAVGVYTDSAGNSVPLAERWDGTSWVIEPTPNPPGAHPREDSTGLSGVSCVSAGACTGVGFYNFSVSLAERWEGTGWTIQPTPSPGPFGSTLSGVSCTAASACTAVGVRDGQYGNEGETLAEQWNGTGWAIQPTPNPPEAQYIQLSGVSCASAGACTAVGGYFNSAEHNLPLAERWTGKTWVIQPTPSPPRAIFSGLLAVSCPSASACTAVGTHGVIEAWTPPSNKFTVTKINTETGGRITFSVQAPGPGSVDVLATAWKDNVANKDSARAAVRLRPASHRFVFARASARAARRGTLSVTVTPNQQGKVLVAHPSYRILLRLWVRYTPDGGRYRTIGYLGLHLPGSCAKHHTVTALHSRTVVRCN